MIFSLKNAAVLDANFNRVAEGLRAIEEYCRFVISHPSFSKRLAALRKEILNSKIYQKNLTSMLVARHTGKDARARETPPRRRNWRELLCANFKRVEEALRVLEEYTGDPAFNQARYDTYDLEKDILLTLLKKPFKTPGIYLISDEVSILEQGLRWGVSLIQLRDKSNPKHVVFNKAMALKKIAEKYATPFLINDYIDIATAVDADGLHTGQDDLPISTLRELLGPQKILGRSTHNLKQGLAAQKAGADYVSVGPLWETPSKPGRKAIGFSYLKEANKLVIPYVAIGGIDHKNADEVLRFTPPLLGLVRDWENIPKLLKLIKVKKPSNPKSPTNDLH